MKDSLKPRQLLMPLLVLVVVIGQYHLQRFMIIPQLREESVLFVDLQEYVRENPNLDRVIFITPPSPFYPTTEYPPGDELGRASITAPKASFLEIRQILAGITHRKYEDLQAADLPPIYSNESADKDMTAPPPGAFMINLEQLQAPR